MKNEKLKKGQYRWRGKFRHLPNRETLVNEIGINWLANRFWTIIYRHLFDHLPDEVQLVRVKSEEFIFIVHKMHNMYNLEIIQKEPFYLPEYY